MIKIFLPVFVMISFLLVTPGCGPSSPDSEEFSCADLPPGKILQQCIDKKAAKADRIDAENDPQLFGVELETKVDALPLNGSAKQIPWPDTYWPTYADSVNARWQGSNVYSPLEKYDLAFNNWKPPEGFDQLRPFQSCGQEFDAAYYEQLGPAAKYWSTNHGNKPKRDAWQAPDCEEKIEGWWGLCHAWVPSAIIEPEPARSVVYNGVTFDVSDIKALLMMAYNKSSTRFLGRRCNEKEIERDENGRVKDSQIECRDTNPGSMHLILANLLGRDQRAFAEDKTVDYQVWNQPVMGFEVSKLDEITEEQATKLTTDCDEKGTDCSNYPWDDEAVKFYEVEAEVRYITESEANRDPVLPEVESYINTDNYNYVLECDAEGNIIGGEWISQEYPDFLWLPLKVGYATNPNASYDKIKMLVDLSFRDELEGLVVETFKNENPLDIPDNDQNGAKSVITVDKDIDVAKLKVTVNINHSYAGDLVVTLKNGNFSTTLMENAGGSTANIVKTFTVSGFTGSAKGDWELMVADVASGDSGQLVSWELIIAGGANLELNPEVFSSSSPITLKDGPRGIINTKITVPGEGTVKELKVNLDIQHDWISDLKIVLKHGTGSMTLHNREGNDQDNLKKTYVAEEFTNSPAGGDWILVVSDMAPENTGILKSWSLEIVR